jgi:hypothetical protein
VDRETPEVESAGASADEDSRAAPLLDDGLLDGLRAQRLSSMLLARERRRLAMHVAFGIERISLDLGRAFSRSVALRVAAIRQRHRASVARLLLPVETSD